MSDRTATDALAAFASSVSVASVPEAVRDQAKRLLLDTVASALAGNGGDEVAQVSALAEAVGGPGGDTTVIGRAPASPAGAALLNGYLITAATVCDVHRPTLCHVTPEVVPPALAIAEREGSTGAELLAALIAGLEVTTRVGLGTVYPTFRAHGWHSPGVIGPFGGAASAGRLLHLDEARMRNALGLAGSQSAGTFAHWGTPTIKFHQSRGALSGLMAALLAETGFQAAPDILGAKDGGLFTSYSEGGDPAATMDRLGERWELMQISLRRWPVASSIQSLVTALFEILEAEPIAPDAIASITVGLSDTVYRMHGELAWDTRFRALLSTRYVVSVIVHDQACWLDQFTPERIADPRLDQFARQQVRVGVDESLPTNGAVVRVQRTDGSVVERRRDVPKGDATDPLGWDAIEAKLHDAAGAMPEADVVGIVSSIRALEGVGDVRQLIASLRGPVQ